MKTREVLVAVPDLFFSTRIMSTAQQLGVEVVACAPSELAACARSAIPDVAIVDLATEIHNLRGSPGGISPNAEGTIRTRLQEVFVKAGGQWQIASYHNVDQKSP